jgi:hypothetical protein
VAVERQIACRSGSSLRSTREWQRAAMRSDRAGSGSIRAVLPIQMLLTSARPGLRRSPWSDASLEIMRDEDWPVLTVGGERVAVEAA